VTARLTSQSEPPKKGNLRGEPDVSGGDGFLARLRGLLLHEGNRHVGAEEYLLCRRAEQRLPRRRAVATADDDEVGVLVAP
jgi:hypothetical protein